VAFGILVNGLVATIEDELPGVNNPIVDNEEPPAEFKRRSRT
jgi:hypothetical protein